MAYSLLTRNSDAAPILKYTALGALAAGQVHAHAMPTPRVVHAHEDASTPEGIIHLYNHAHTINFYKYHKHFIESIEPLLHAHDGVIEHKHTIAYQDETYKYSVTRQTGTDAPVVTPDVGTAAVIRVPDGSSQTDTENADVVVELADTETLGDNDHLVVGPSANSGYYEPGSNYAEVETATDSVADISVGLALDETPQSKVVTTSATTDTAMHKGGVGANPAVETNANGDNNKVIMLDATDSLAGDILGIGSGEASGYSNTYHKQTSPTGYYPTEPDTSKWLAAPSLSGFAGWSLTSWDPSLTWDYPMIRFYKLGDSPEGIWTPRTCNEVLSVNPDMTDVPSTLAFVGTYNLGAEGYGVEQWLDTSDNYVGYDTDAWYIYNYYTGAAYKKLADNAFDPTGDYDGINGNTGTYVISSTATPGSFRANWKTLPELQYSPIKKAYHGQHQHDITDTPDYTSVEHDHADQMYDYQHRHQCEFPKHKHTPPEGADFESHKHTVTLTDHSHAPVVYGIWRTVSILSNVTFKRIDDVSPWVLFAVDTIQVSYPSPIVGAEVADVEWTVSKATSLSADMESTVDLATDIDPTIGEEDAGEQEGTRYTDQVTIEDIPLAFGDYIAGVPELEWVTGAKTALAYHIGVGEAAGTPEEQSLVSPLDATHSMLVRNNGVLERMKVGRLPTGIAHTHSYTDKAFKLLAHPHDVVFPWRGELAHTHTMYLADPHSHPQKNIPTESHKHNIVACDETPHTHAVNSTEEASAFVTGIDNVVDDTFDEDIDSSETVCYPLSTGSANGAETGVATVTTTDNALSMLHVVSTVDPTLDGDYQKTFKSITGNAFYLVSWIKIDDPTKSFGDNGSGWYVLNGVAYRSYASGPVGDYGTAEYPYPLYATVTNSTLLGAKDVGISRDITTSAEKKFVPHKYYGQSTLRAYIWDWAAETFDPVISSFDTADQEGSLTAVDDDGEVDFTMTGATDEKLHSGI